MGLTNLLYCFSNNIKAEVRYSKDFKIVDDVLTNNSLGGREWTFKAPTYFFTFLSRAWY